ncbi:MAG: response regulator transcription factor [Clostridium beijerinckii]|jgi:DNA-binding response OmpR family regulator|nr:response regulator transcription factor [Clostridium beijerinckii]MCI1581551.1 response regulator transcription factor [Clostridium beijerinckii]MCI1585944.1 response regulator transcription factor [Clostridium beijerinckii]MCI1625096.1 response regulator transcription factor [Clostridium beijerinckii]
MSRVLLVEDDKDLSYMTSYVLQKEKLSVDVADCLKEADELFNRGTYDLIILDVILPDGLGYELCKKIRTKSNIPIIFLTCCDDEVNVVTGLDLGGDDYVSKPYRARELVSRVNSALRRNGQTKNKEVVIRSGEIKVFVEQHKVLASEDEIILTSTEYKLLLAFLNAPYQVLTRAVLLERIWDVEGNFVEDNTLSVYIKKLRLKLNEINESFDYIITIRGVGYKWNMDVVKL